MRKQHAVAVLILFSAAACGDSPTGPSSGTRVDTTVQDSPAGTATVIGTLAGNVHASLWNGDRWIDVGSPNGITIPLQIAGRTTTVHGEASIPASSYTRVRLTFQGVTARLASGSTIGGATLTSDRTLVLGGSDQRVEMSVDVSRFAVEPEARVRQVVVFDLHSGQWLTEAAVQAGRVEDAPIQTAMTATVRAENR